MSIRAPLSRHPLLTLAALTTVALPLAPAWGAAQEPPTPPPAAAPAEPGVDVPSDAEEGGGGKKKKKRAAESTGTDGAPATVVAGSGDARVELRGRVFAAAIYEDQNLERDVTGVRSDASALNLTVTSARFGVAVDVLDFVSLQIEAELAGSRARLRDGFVQAKQKRWLVRGGQFKMPISVFTLESPWKLPLARRGWLHELLSDHLLLSGRREGFMGQVNAGGSLDPALTLGAFRSVQWGQNAGDPIESLTPRQQTLVGRLSITPAGFEVAAVGQRRTTFVDTAMASYHAAGLESTGEIELESTAFRYWAEGLVGSNFLSFTPMSRQTVTFFTARALAAWRWGGLQAGELYVEPFVTAGMLDPDSSTTADGFLEVMGGLNVGHWRRTRLTLQLEYAAGARNFPRAYFIDYLQPFLARHLAAILQVGAAF